MLLMFINLGHHSLGETRVSGVAWASGSSKSSGGFGMGPTFHMWGKPFWAKIGWKGMLKVTLTIYQQND